MKHLRKFNENSNRPGPNTGAKSITISNDEVDSFSTEPSLQKLIADEKVSVIGNKVYYNDDETKSILDEYLEVAGKVEEVTENLSTELNKDTILHILKLKIEESLSKSVKASGRPGDTFNKFFNGKKEAYQEILDMISKFEK
jgi:hypothetical protein